MDGFDDEATHDFPYDAFRDNETSTVDVEDFDNDSTPGFDNASNNGVDDEATHDLSADTFSKDEASTDNLPDNAWSNYETSTFDACSAIDDCDDAYVAFETTIDDDDDDDSTIESSYDDNLYIFHIHGKTPYGLSSFLCDSTTNVGCRIYSD